MPKLKDTNSDIIFPRLDSIMVRSQRAELLARLIKEVPDQDHARILKAYAESGTVTSAEQEFAKIIQEISDED